MTVEDAGVRRSRRIQDKGASQPVYEDDEIDGEQYDNDEQDEDFEQSTPRKRKRALTSTKPKQTKKAKTGESQFAELRQEFEQHYLFEALNDGEVSVAELATEWVDQYKNGKDIAKRDLVNFVLNAVGCFTKIEEHDVANNESASETVGEIQTFFKRQKLHEFFIMSKKPEHKHLKKNLIQFIAHIISISDENGLLYENVLIEEDAEEEESLQETNVVEDMLIWLSSFSVCNVRALRYISTLCLFTMETALCRSSQKNNIALEKFKKQLAVEKAKKQTAAAKKRVDQVQSTVDDYVRQSEILENFIEDVVNTTFIHRFKDVDSHIRVDAMSSLGEWMELAPQTFYNVKYLKYLGWVLSDESSSVRLQVLKTLVKLLKHNTVTAGVRQFFERFKDRIVEMALSDIDVHVKNNAVTLLTEVNKLGFLDEAEVAKLSSLIFHWDEKKNTSLVASFIRTVQEERTLETLEAHRTAIDLEQNGFPFSLEEGIRLANLVSILGEAHAEHETGVSGFKPDTLEVSDFAKVGKALADSKGLSDITLDTSIELFLLDNSTLSSVDKEVSKLIALDGPDRTVLLGLIHGFLLSVYENLGKNNVSFSPKLISQIPKLLKKSENSTADLSEFIQIFALLPLSYFEEHNETTTFKKVYQTLVKHFKNNDMIALKHEYVLLANILTTSPESTTITEVTTLFQDFVSELRIELSNFLKSPDFEFSVESLEQLHDDFLTKLLLLGKTIDVSQILPLFETVKEQLLLTLTDFDLSNPIVHSAVSGIFQLMMSALTWRLNHLLKTNELHDVEKELKVLVEVLDEAKDIIKEKTKIPIRIRTSVAKTTMDIYTMVKGFFLAYEKSEKTNLSNVSRFKEMEFPDMVLPDPLVSALKDIFLRNEAYYASIIEVMLERDDDEDIAYNDINAQFDDDEEKEAVQWAAERELVVFTAKLLRIAKYGMISDPETLIKRIDLNADILGDLYANVVVSEVGGAEEEEEEEATAKPIQKGVQRLHGTRVEEENGPVIQHESTTIEEADVAMIDAE
ncbi:Cohesin subunit SCC3 [Cyberlindnera fabianii]|uniref:Cohesin subunit SCC3 n=1 Tax=Cyberlindnera fabianii TaxID=36022 RepID=A0A1V2L4I5_CYBFA|nr:Cohesin subunit SCC3 [Cyberlindnera fabianii]